MKKAWIVVSLLIVVIVIASLFIFVGRDRYVLNFLNQEIDLMVADTPFEHQKGLSGVELESFSADGMLFVFSDQKQRTFWMKDMNFNLDVLWIKDGKVMKIDHDVPAPAIGQEPEKMYSRPFEVDMVIELPAGKANEIGFVEGHILPIEL